MDEGSDQPAAEGDDTFGETFGDTFAETFGDRPGTREVAEDDAPPDVPDPPATGDTAVDEAMVELARAQPGSFAERIESGERAHRALQGRLDDLGGA